MATRRSLSPAAEWAARLGLVVVSVLLALAALELGCRLWRGHYWLSHWPNLVAGGDVYDPAYPRGRIAYDARLGFVPTPGFRSVPYSADDEGNRLIPSLPAGIGEGPPILTTGDSFTYGEEVADDQTWPGYLQTLTGRRTINAGVPAYGVDQTVLRTEARAASVRPAVIVASFIADDLRRNELNRLGGWEKPYFAVESDGTLALRNVPVPPGSDFDEMRTFWQQAFGWSILADVVAIRLGWRESWEVGTERATPAGTGKRLACPLMQRLAQLGTPTLVVAQYDPTYWRTADDDDRAEVLRQSRLVLRCASQSGLATLDTFEVIDKAVRARGLEAMYVVDHHNADGNRLIAEAIAAELERRHMMPR